MNIDLHTIDLLDYENLPQKFVILNSNSTFNSITELKELNNFNSKILESNLMEIILKF
jgi:hypothetical protein